MGAREDNRKRLYLEDVDDYSVVGAGRGRQRIRKQRRSSCSETGI